MSSVVVKVAGCNGPLQGNSGKENRREYAQGPSTGKSKEMVKRV
jgi:hypothetical protein